MKAKLEQIKKEIDESKKVADLYVSYFKNEITYSKFVEEAVKVHEAYKTFSKEEIVWMKEWYEEMAEQSKAYYKSSNSIFTALIDIDNIVNARHEDELGDNEELNDLVENYFYGQFRELNYGILVDYANN